LLLGRGLAQRFDPLDGALGQRDVEPDGAGAAGPALVEQDDLVVPQRPRQPGRGGGVQRPRRLGSRSALEEHEIGLVLAARTGGDAGEQLERGRGVVVMVQRDVHGDVAQRHAGHLPLGGQGCRHRIEGGGHVWSLLLSAGSGSEARAGSGQARPGPARLAIGIGGAAAARGGPTREWYRGGGRALRGRGGDQGLPESGTGPGAGAGSGAGAGPRAGSASGAGRGSRVVSPAKNSQSKVCSSPGRSLRSRARPTTTSEMRTKASWSP